MHRSLPFVLCSVFLVSCVSLPGPPATNFFSEPKLLHFAEAAASGDTSTLDRLIKSGVNVNATGRGDMTATLWALLHQNKKGVGYLLAHGANPNVQLTETFDDLVIEGNSVISFAAMHEDSWYLKEVLKHSGDPNLVNATRSHTPIFSSIFSRRPENARILIAAGANLNWQDRDGETALDAAAVACFYDLFYAMLEAEADPTIKNRWGSTVLSTIKTIRTDPKSSQWQWRQKVIDRMRAKGIDVDNGR
ncbi:MAG TPA: ankyrin repeat domain-containing protein [Lacunisphaera sp.]|nr:ankyrin repeat domain-containing protein [Lacunisphaera sp.]